MDLVAPSVSGWYGNAMAFGAPPDGSPMRYQSIDNAYFTVNVSVDADSGVALLLARVEVLTSVSDDWVDDASSACRDAVGVEVFPWISLPIPTSVPGVVSSQAPQQYALPIDTLHGSIYRVSVRAIDRAGNVNTSSLNCVRVDKTRVSVSLHTPVVVDTVVSDDWTVGVREGADGSLLYSGPTADMVLAAALPNITVSVTATEDITPLSRVTTCWSSNVFGTCDVVPRATTTFNGTKVLTYTGSTVLTLDDADVRAKLDGRSVCAWMVSARGGASFT